MTEETTITPMPEFDTDAALKSGRRLAGAKLDAARAAVSTLDGVVRWAAYEDAEEAEKSLVVTTGTALKALGNGKIGGHLVVFGDAEHPDLSQSADYFTADTDYDLDEDGTGKSTVLYHHGMDDTLKRRKLGRATLRTDTVGVWMEAQLALRDDYEQAVYSLIEAGKMGLSSGTAPHLVEREPQANGTHKITRWPLGLDASITPIPAEPRTSVVALKTYLDMAEPYVKALSQVGAIKASTTDATKAEPEPEQLTLETHGEYPMTDEQLQALIAQAAKDAGENAVKAYEAKLAAEPAINPAGVALSQPAEVKAKPEGFKTLGEQLIAVMHAAQNGGAVDRRLLEIKAPAGMSEIIASDGGYLVQEDFATELFKRMYSTGAVASRTRRIPISGNANGLTMNAVSESSRASGSRWGGVAAYWLSEAGSKSETMPEFRKMEVKLNKLAALAYATDELLQDSSALEGILSQAFAEELGWKLDDAIIRGTGVGQPLGILNAPCLVSVTKETGQAADTIVWQNVSKMWSRLWAPSRSNAVWFVNQDVEPQLQSMSLAVGTGGVPVYMPANGAAGQMYSTLFGRPVIAIEQADTVGDQGDIMLLDLSQYLLIEKGGIQSASSIHVKFTTDETAFRWVLRVGGQPLWNTTLTSAYSSLTQSPFVVLDARA